MSKLTDPAVRAQAAITPQQLQALPLVQNAQRLVVKVGSSLVTNEGKGLDAEAISRWGAQFAALRKQGKDVVMVSSGAIAEGMKRLGWTKRPSEIHELQAAAAVGQMGLAHVYESRFREHGLATAQVLLTHEDLSDRKRYLNARSTLLTLLKHQVVPIINENDTVVTDEIKVGDNDTLGALVANLIDADVLIILTDQEGLFTADPRKDPRAQFLSAVCAGDPILETMAGGAGSSIGKGGMITKVLAAKRAASRGAHTIVASGRQDRVLERLANGEFFGTQFIAQTQPLAARKQWLQDHLQLKGTLVLDPGAVRALLEGGKSLLPIGVAQVQGEFQRGEAVAICDSSGKEVARGLSNYASGEARMIMRKPSTEIESILGFVEEPELVHRDNLVLK
jgi:glutamate 5-kinase